MAHIVQAIRGRKGIVLVRLQNIAMHIAQKGPCYTHSLVINEEARLCAQSLQIEPVTAFFRDLELAIPCGLGIGRQRIATLLRKIYYRVDARAALPCALKTRLTP